MKYLTLSLALFALSGCNGAVEGIPCTEYNDLECPTGYWCKSTLLVNTRWECVVEEEVPKPQISVLGVARLNGQQASELDDFAFSDVVSVDRNYLKMAVRLRNNSGRARLGVDVGMKSDCCLSGPGDFRIGGFSVIDAGETFDVEIELRRISSGCPERVPFTLNFSESESGATLDYEFEVELLPFADDGTCDSCDYISSNNCE